jgi:hypothetical protein
MLHRSAINTFDVAIGNSRIKTGIKPSRNFDFVKLIHQCYTLDHILCKGFLIISVLQWNRRNHFIISCRALKTFSMENVSANFNWPLVN